MKICFRCKEPKELNDFHKNKTQVDGHSNQCKLCAVSKRNEHYRNNLESSRKYSREWQRAHQTSRLIYNKQYIKNNPDKKKQWNANVPLEKKLLYGARQRAKERNLPCLINERDIIVPEFCPILNIKLERGNGKVQDASPSLDCRIPSLGYVPGNIAVISFRANTIKSSATIDELDKVSAWLKQ